MGGTAPPIQSVDLLSILSAIIVFGYGGDFMKLKSVDIIALVLIVGCLLLIWSGHDGDIKATLGVVVGFYFSRSVGSPVD